ncbi:uncharacterized protein [Palaemon carinicauda]|uniref:uncharacterized protein n=1 Tax=Palaemon carinicauda TaxID=392227 RepID=UPI0035B5B65B
MEEELKHLIQAGWSNWRAASVVLCDKRVSPRLKGKFHKTIPRTAMIYDKKTASLRKTDEKNRDVAEMRMFRWMFGMTRKERIRNDYIRRSRKVLAISKKVQKGRLR